MNHGRQRDDQTGRSGTVTWQSRKDGVIRDRIEGFYYAYYYGDYESLTRWLSVHVSILLATVLSGYAVARERSLLALAPVSFPLLYLYKRYEKARTDNVQADTPV